MQRGGNPTVKIGPRDLRKEFPEKVFFPFQHKMKGRDKASDKQHTIFLTEIVLQVLFLNHT